MSIEEFKRAAALEIEHLKPLCSRCNKVKIDRAVALDGLEGRFCKDCAKDDKEKLMVFIEEKISEEVERETNKAMTNLMLYGDSRGTP